MKYVFILLVIIFVSESFAQNRMQIKLNQFNLYTNFGNYNPPDDPAIDTGWLICGLFFYLNRKDAGIILSAYGIGVYYDSRKFLPDYEGNVHENRRIIHKKKNKYKHIR